MLDHLLQVKLQAQATRNLDLLLKENELCRFLKNYLIACKVEGKSPATIMIYHRVISYFIDYSLRCGLPQKAGTISANDIRLFLLDLQQKKLAPATVNAYYRAMNTFFNWLVNEGYIEKSPMLNIKPPKVPRMVVTPLNKEQITELLRWCGSVSFIDLRNRAIILLFLETGLRLAELARIQLNDIDFDNETIKVMGKGSKERLVRIGKTTQRALLKYILARSDEYPCLWLTEERKPMASSGIQTMVKRLFRYSGINGVKRGPHTLRHTAAINYLRNGGDQFTLQIMLGHASLDMTRKYVSTLGTEDMIRVHRKASPVDNLGLK